ncbi:MAG: restriction endonuclease subunit S [Flavobacteriia bacterium]|nr:restriction endonuclease subunit S [Flavobacteriia bacterium]
MNNFQFKKLNELCSRITDGSHYSPSGIDFGFPMLSVKDMNENSFSYDSCKYISKEDYLDLVKSDCKPLLNDVLIAKDGSYLKHVFVIKKEIDQAILSSIGILRPDLKKINPEYLKYYLQTSSVKETVAKKYVSGSALPRIILRNFGEIDVIYKDLETQSKIAKVLSYLDAKIELNNKINAELEAMAKLIYDYWFVQFDFPNEEGKPYKSSGGKMVWNEELKREIPEGWEVEKLSNCCEIIDCLHSKKSDFVFEDEKYYLLQLENISDDGLIDLKNKYYVTKSEYARWTSRIEVKDHDLVITNAGRVAGLSQIPKNVTAGIGRNITAIRPKKIQPTFLFNSFQSAEMKRQIKLNTDKGSL